MGITETHWDLVRNYGITDSMDVSLSELRELVMDREEEKETEAKVTRD